MSSRKDSSKETARRLQQALINKGWTAARLCEESGVPKSSVSQYLHGYHAPSNIAAGKLGKALGVSPAWLMGFGGSDEKLVNKTIAAKESMCEMIGKNITNRRFDCGLSSSQLADKVGVPVSTILAIEDGHRQSMYLVEKIAKALDTDAATLMKKQKQFPADYIVDDEETGIQFQLEMVPRTRYDELTPINKKIIDGLIDELLNAQKEMDVKKHED